jgi:hypothetical protein
MIGALSRRQVKLGNSPTLELAPELSDTGNGIGSISERLSPLACSGSRSGPCPKRCIYNACFCG